MHEGAVRNIDKLYVLKNPVKSNKDFIICQRESSHIDRKKKEKWCVEKQQAIDATSIAWVGRHGSC